MDFFEERVARAARRDMRRFQQPTTRCTKVHLFHLLFDAATAFDVDVGAGSAANISAVAPDNMYIADFDSTASSLHVLQQVVQASSEGSSRSRLQVDRPPGDKVQPHQILHFDALAFHWRAVPATRRASYATARCFHRPDSAIVAFSAQR
jgi:hypothetical protein